MPRAVGSTNRNYPSLSLVDALSVARVIQEEASGQPVSRLTLAGLLGTTPNSSAFKSLIGASRAFGLTSGGINADLFGLTPLGDQVTGADEIMRERGLKRAVTNIEPYRMFVSTYNGKRVPSPAVLGEWLVKNADVPADRAEECVGRLIEDIDDAGLIRVIKGSDYVSLEDAAAGEALIGRADTASDADDVDHKAAASENEQPPSLAPPVAPVSPLKKVFIAHGKSREPLQQLKAVLDKFKVQYAVAVEEPNKGRPISLKLAQLMREECSSAIFIFTADERFERRDDNGEVVEVWRPSENVVYELGAASVLYDSRIVVFKERSVSFPSDFNDLGYIEFDKDDLGRETAALFSELVGLDILEVRAKG